MNTIKRINLTQHEASPEQDCAPRTPEDAKTIKNLITFEELPGLKEISDRARKLALFAKEQGATEAMIGGAPYFMPSLDAALRIQKIEPVYAFSRRESVDTILPDGTTKKISTFKHVGFVWV